MNRPIRLLIVSLSLDGGGAERVASTLLSRLDRGLVRPSLCLLRNRVTYPISAEVPVHDLGYRGLPTLPRTVHRLRRLVADSEPDIVLSMINSTNLVTGQALQSPDIRIPWIARVGTGRGVRDRLGLRSWQENRVYPRAARLVANSAGLAREYRDRFPSLEARISEIANPVDLDALNRLAAEAPCLPRTGDRPVVIAMGRMSTEKRHDVLLRSFARLRDSIDAELWICGDGPLRDRTRRLARALRIDGSVRWPGFVPNPYPLIRTADLFVLTSDHEGLPNALIEAQALGVPAVATRCPHGPEEIIEDGITGVLVPCGSEAPIANAMRELLVDPGRRRTMSRAASERATRLFDAGVRTREWESLVLSAAGFSRA